MDQDKTSHQKKVWEYPWRYTESFLIALGLLITGFGIEIVSKGQGIELIKWPVNLYIGFIFIAIISLSHVYFRKTNFIKWFSSVPAAIGSISLFTILALFIGLVPQGGEESNIILKYLGLTHLTTSWAYALAQIYFLFTLGLVAVKRLTPFNIKNIGFVLNHAGLWITITAASLGSGDLQRLTMKLQENQTQWLATDDKGKTFEMPVAVKLIDFDIEEYNPKLTIIDNATGQIIHDDGKNILQVEENINAMILDWEIQVKEFHTMSGKNGENYHPVNDIGACPSILVKAINKETNEEAEGWVTCGSFRMQSEALKLNDDHSLVMMIPEAKRYSSKVQLYTKSGKNEETIIEVNKPYEIDGWKLYQVSYDSDMGRWSTASVIELIRDSWLPGVYLGIFMLIAGAVYMFWTGNRKKIEN